MTIVMRARFTARLAPVVTFAFGAATLLAAFAFGLAFDSVFDLLLVLVMTRSPGGCSGP